MGYAFMPMARAFLTLAAGPLLVVACAAQTPVVLTTAEAIAESVIRVECASPATGGSGFIHRSGHVLTAAHVIAACKPKQLFVGRLGRFVSGAEPVALDVTNDIAVLRVLSPPSGELGLRLAAPTTARLGRRVLAVGYPEDYQGEAPLVTAGIVAGTQHVDFGDGNTERLLVNAAIGRGVSGGPVVQETTGEVLGIVVRKLDPVQQGLLDRLSRYREAQRSDPALPADQQLIGELLEHLRHAVHSGFGYVATTASLRELLARQGIEP